MLADADTKHRRSPTQRTMASRYGDPLQQYMWFGSANVSAALHFDIEDNFYVQLSGHKRWLLLPPEAALSVGGHATLHSSWRQGT